VTTPRIITAQALKGSAELVAIVGNRVFSASAVNKQMKRPLVTIRSHTDFPAVRNVGQRGYIQVWAHDDPGDYERIDQILDLSRTAIEAVQPSVVLGPFLEARWIETGVDLRDDVMESITRYMRFQFTFTRREAS
jgi:hypothetical protein